MCILDFSRRSTTDRLCPITMPDLLHARLCFVVVGYGMQRVIRGRVPAFTERSVPFLAHYVDQPDPSASGGLLPRLSFSLLLQAHSPTWSRPMTVERSSLSLLLHLAVKGAGSTKITPHHHPAFAKPVCGRACPQPEPQPHTRHVESLERMNAALKVCVCVICIRRPIASRHAW